MTLILFTTYAPHPLGLDLSRAGFRVYDALAISEVLALKEKEADAQIVISAEVEPERAKLIQRHHMTLCLKPKATAADVIWEREQLFPQDSTRQ